MSGQEPPDPTTAVQDLREAVAGFARFIEGLPEAALVEKAWGPREVLAHLVYWLESYVTQTEALLANQAPELPEGQFDDLNATAVEATRGVPISELLPRYQTACDWLCEVAQRHDAGSIVLVLKDGSAFQHSLPGYMSAEAGHIRVHQRMLEGQLSREYLSDLETLHATVDRFCRFIRGLPEAELDLPGGPRDVLAYLVFWCGDCVAQVEAIVAEKPYAAPEGRLKDVDARAVEAGRGVAVDELLGRLQRANERLQGFGRTLDPQNVVVKFRAHHHTLDGAIARIETHIRSRHGKLKRAVPKLGA